MATNIKNLLTIAAPFAVAVGAFFQFGYWGALDVSVLEFVGLMDLAKLAFYPLTLTLITVILGTAVTESFLGERPDGRRTAHAALPPVRAMHAGWVLLPAMVASLGIYMFMENEQTKWHLIAVMASLFAVPFNHAPFLVELVPDRNVRRLGVFLLVVTPMLAFAEGRSKAHSAIHLKGASIVDVVRSKVDLKTDAASPVLYLGLLGETYILKESLTGSLVFLKRGDAPLIVTPRIPKVVAKPT